MASNSHFQCAPDLTRKFLSRWEEHLEILRKAVGLTRDLCVTSGELGMCHLENIRSACQPLAGRDLGLMGRSYRRKDLGLKISLREQHQVLCQTHNGSWVNVQVDR